MSSDLEEEAGEIRLEERLAAPMAVALARLLGEAEESSAGPCRQRTILDVARQLSQIGRESLPGEWVRMERERREEKLSEICQKERQEAGAGEARDLSGTLINLAESRRIKPNQTCGGWVLMNAPTRTVYAQVSVPQIVVRVRNGVWRGLGLGL
jgi:hypothetical protein